MKLHLKKRKQSKKGMISLYLEYYKGYERKPNGKIKHLRDYEYLELYLFDNPKNPIDTKHNKDTLELADDILAKRRLEIKNGQYGFNTKHKQKTKFLAYFERLAENRKRSKGNYGNWLSTLKHLEKYCKPNISFEDVDQSFVLGFKQYLENEATNKSFKPLSRNTQHSYFNKLKAAINQAFEENIIQKLPTRIKKANGSYETISIKAENPEKEYLTIEEIRKIAKAECRYEVLKIAFLFSCLTGMRWADVNSLTWSNLKEVDGGYQVVFKQKKTSKKTGKTDYLDISDQARKILGEEKDSDERIFKGLKYSAWHNVALQKWMMKAGITKHITFHCARHTFAVNQLELDTDIYTLSKLLGHSDLRTTQIYAKVMDKKKRKAMNKFPDIDF